MDTAKKKKKTFLGFGQWAGDCLTVSELLAEQASAVGLQREF